MFHESLEVAWLDKVDRRYSWLRRTLINYEEECVPIFPSEWGIPERVCIEFCNNTRLVEFLHTVLLSHSLSLSPPSLSSPYFPSFFPLLSLPSPPLPRESISSLMRGRGADIEVKLLLFAIQKTTAFEKMLAQRFVSSAYLESVSVAVCLLWK